VHRSEIVGEIVPAKTKTKIFNLKKFREFIKLPKLKNQPTDDERKNIYRKHLEEKYGKGIS
jgi:hypothetical protein